MRVHSSIFPSHIDFTQALRESGLQAEGVFVDSVVPHGSRSRDRARELSLAANAGRDRFGKVRRPKNSGRFGAESGYDKAATYDEWGVFIAELFRRDPEMKFGPYDGVQDFHEKTRYQYVRESASA